MCLCFRVGRGCVSTLLLAQDLEVLKRGLFLVGEMAQMALRISIFHLCGLDSVRRTGCRHDACGCLRADSVGFAM